MATGGFALLFRPNKEEGARKARFDDARFSRRSRKARSSEAVRPARRRPQERS